MDGDFVLGLYGIVATVYLFAAIKWNGEQIEWTDVVWILLAGIYIFPFAVLGQIRHAFTGNALFGRG